MSRLVWYKSAVIYKELDAVCCNETWPEWQDPALVKPHLVEKCRSIALQLALRNQTIHQHCNQYPHKLLIIGWKNPEDCCEQRRAVFQELLETDDDRLHVTARKIKHMFSKEIQAHIVPGTCSMPLYTLMRLVAITWRPEVRFLRCNSLPSFNVRVCLGCRGQTRKL